MIKLKWVSKEAGKYRPTRSDNKRDVKFGEVVEVDKETADYYLSAYSKHFELATSEVKPESVSKSEVKPKPVSKSEVKPKSVSKSEVKKTIKK